ncbi:MAG: putative quinol monooxygenase [Actinomycetota bacterium]
MSDSPDIVVIGRFDVAPDTLDALREALVAMQDASRAEDGCHDYTFSVEVADPAVVRLSERWESIDALRAHFTQPHMATFGEALAANPPLSSSVQFFEATEIDRPS